MQGFTCGAVDVERRSQQVDTGRCYILPGATLIMLAQDCFYHSWMLGKQKDAPKFCGPKVLLLHQHLRCWAKHAPAPRPLVISFAKWWDCADTGNISLDGSGQLCVTWSAARGWSVTIRVCARYLSLGTEVFAFHVFICFFMFFFFCVFFSMWVLVDLLQERFPRENWCEICLDFWGFVSVGFRFRTHFGWGQEYEMATCNHPKGGLIMRLERTWT